MTAMAYGKEVHAVEQYFGRINADKFFFFVCEHIANIFKTCLRHV